MTIALYVNTHKVYVALFAWDKGLYFKKCELLGDFKKIVEVYVRSAIMHELDLALTMITMW